MNDYLAWVVETIAQELFPGTDGFYNSDIYNEVRKLVMEHSSILSDRFSPEAYLKETEEK